MAVRGELATVLAMLDRSQFTYLSSVAQSGRPIVSRCRSSVNGSSMGERPSSESDISTPPGLRLAFPRATAQRPCARVGRMARPVALGFEAPAALLGYDPDR
jgi:hypothetical protein